MTQWLRGTLAALVGVALVALAPPAFTQAASATSIPAVVILPKTRIDVAGHRIDVEVADTPATRERGLMFRFSIPPDEGMLFVFDAPQGQSFWMRNTYAPLSIAFIDVQGRVVNIEDMAPRSDDTHASRGPVLYALEMRQGWFQRNGITAGATVRGLPRPSPQ